MADKIKSDHFQKKLENGVAKKLDKKPHDSEIVITESPGWGEGKNKFGELSKEKNSEGGGRKI